MTKVFISYARADEKSATDLRDDFLYCGVEVWMDLFDIPIGSRNWDREIHNALQQASHLVLIHTQNSFSSDEVWSEWREFLAYGKPVIPLIVENVPLPFRLRQVQFVDFCSVPFEVSFPKLLDAILFQFPTPPDWNGSPDLLPLPLSKTEATYALPAPHDDSIEIEIDQYSDRVNWAEEIRAKQLLQRQLIDQNLRNLYNAINTDTPPPRAEFILIDITNYRSLSHFLPCDRSARQSVPIDRAISDILTSSRQYFELNNRGNSITWDTISPFLSSIQNNYDARDNISIKGNVAHYQNGKAFRQRPITYQPFVRLRNNLEYYRN